MIIQKIFLIVMLLALWVTWRRARQQVIGKREAAGWSVIWIGAAVVVMLPSVTSNLAARVGVGRGVDLVVYASVAVLFILVFKLFIQHEKIERKLTEAVRHEALRDLDAPAAPERPASVPIPVEVVKPLPEKPLRPDDADMSFTQQTLQAFMLDASLHQSEFMEVEPDPKDLKS